MKTGCPKAPVKMSAPAKLANKVFYLFLRRGVFMTTIITRTFKHMLNGSTIELAIITDINAADVSLLT